MNLISRIAYLLRLEALPALFLIFTLILALILANSPYSNSYQNLWATKLALGFGNYQLKLSLLHWINEGLMALFFMGLSLEIKRECLEGQLAQPSQVILPLVAAFGGTLIPALFFLGFNPKEPASVGWAIPTATDVALALGLVTLLGSKVPHALKMFLVVLAIVDDIVAIAIIAIFYTQHIAYFALGLAALGCLGLLLLNLLKITRLSLYFFMGILTWLALLKSGIHASLMGVIIGLIIPFKVNYRQKNPLIYLEKTLAPFVNYLILPVFILSNAGVTLNQIRFQDLLAPVPLGIAVGLFLGKQCGIFCFSALLIKARWACLPKNSTWVQLYGISILGGIGFTMSLFISNLAYNGQHYELMSKVGILLGSFLSAFIGGGILIWASKRSDFHQSENPRK